MTRTVKEVITQRRLQCLVHSYLYYRLCTSIITDATFDRWAKELKRLQDDNPEIAAECPFHSDFIGWDGTTGYHLPLYGSWVERKAKQLLTRIKAMGGDLTL